mgnify:FL=1
MKIKKTVFGLVLTLIVIFMSSCTGFYPCTQRINSNPNYIEDLALEYGFEEYSIIETYYSHASSLYQFMDQPQGLTPDRPYILLMEWKT